MSPAFARRGVGLLNYDRLVFDLLDQVLATLEVTNHLATARDLDGATGAFNDLVEVCRLNDVIALPTLGGVASDSYHGGTYPFSRR